jgi:predicted component of type VI protein secretion system
VENKSYEMLTERSKDFRVALYYTGAATQTRTAWPACSTAW